MRTRKPRMRRLASLLALLSFATGERAARAEPGDELTVSALTFGPGDHPFFKFGHNALLVKPKQGKGWVYNFGTFAFDSPALIPKFLRGNFYYWLSVSTFEETVASYAAANRSILAQDLELTAAQKSALWQALRVNARPENREYLYDYFYDNCSTRVRDAVDRAVGGRVRQAGQGAAALTFRGHALRMVADLWPEYVGLYLGLGRGADVPITRWEEAFLPDRLADLLRAARVPADSGEKPLVKSEAVLHRAVRPEKPAVPPDWSVYFLLLGVAFGGSMLLLGRLARRSAAARVVLGTATSATGASFGFLGLVMVCLWAFTNHRAAFANANILQLGPWAVVLFGYGIGVALGWPRATRRACAIALSLAVFAAAGMVCKLLPGMNQDNWPIIAFCLPAWLGLWRGLFPLARSAK
ncbi:MAG: DUF4105 domain-containing protein [Deltaproteobacteria bacterium]|nr:DUF4105 domain-containing protein [Deltaproteobacteria bacterium]